MDASQTCDILLSHLKMSLLNWNLVESPFSVTISVKKTFVKDKFGHPQTSGLYSQNGDQLTGELNQLPRENKSLQEALDRVGQNYLEAKKKLEIKEENFELYQAQTKSATNAKVKELEHELTLHQEDVIAINSSNEMLKQKIVNLNKELSVSRTKSKNEIEDIKKKSKQEIKSWRKELGEERSKNIKLELKLKAALDKTVEEEKPLPVDAESSLASIPVEGALEC